MKSTYEAPSLVSDTQKLQCMLYYIMNIMKIMVSIDSTIQTNSGERMQYFQKNTIENVKRKYKKVLL